MTSSQELSNNDCLFCSEEQTQGLTIMMNEALIAKHASNQSDNLIAYIDTIMKLQEPCNPYEAWVSYQYKEYQVLDQHDEFLKREYGMDQYGGKITMLTQYYKFHVDLPRVVEKSIQKIIGKYYDKKRECDYKKIKKILKQEQGLSITSVEESESSIGDSAIEKKSKYSTLLNALEDTKLKEDNMMSDSNLLKDMCKVIDKALPSNKHDNHFDIKGSFHPFNNHRIFQDYLKRQERKMKPKLRVIQKHQAAYPTRAIHLQQLLRKKHKQQFSRSKEKDSNVRDSRQIRKKEKESKFIYNTNIKIEIKNAMFYSHGQNQQPPFHIGNIQYDSANKMDPRFRKKNIINQVNFLNQESNKKLVTQIYKSTQQDLKKKLQNSSSRQRMTTKESMNRSQSKNRKNSLSKQSTKELRKGNSGASSARKIIVSNNQIAIAGRTNKLPSRSTSAGNLKKRSYSSNAVGPVIVPSTLFHKQQMLFEKRPIQTISRYGSSDAQTISRETNLLQKQRRAASIKEILNRKLVFKKQ